MVGLTATVICKGGHRLTKKAESSGATRFRLGTPPLRHLRSHSAGLSSRTMKAKIGITILFLSLALPTLGATTYYVDSAKGDDHNPGTSPDSAWRSMDRINKFSFTPGDVILLRRGEVWREELDFPSSGNASAPITIDAYGSGELPIISGADLADSRSWTQSSTYVWQMPAKTQPNVVIFDGVRGHRKAAIGEQAAPLDWA